MDYWINNNIAPSWAGSLARFLAEPILLLMQLRWTGRGVDLSSEPSRSWNTPCYCLAPSSFKHDLFFPHTARWWEGGDAEPAPLALQQAHGMRESLLGHTGIWGAGFLLRKKQAMRSAPVLLIIPCLLMSRGSNVSRSFPEIVHLLRSCFLNKASLLAFTQGGVRL